MSRKRLAILGSTGSVGVQTLAVAREFPDRYEVVTLGAGRNVGKLAEQVREHRPACVAVAEPAAARELEAALGDVDVRIEVGPEGMAAVASADVDLVVAAIVGAAGLEPTLAAIRAGHDVALANKESLVTAGALVLREARRHGVTILPVDSEHSAIFQALGQEPRESVARLILTASGGPFRTWPADRIAGATVEEALNHPNWDMGPKITIDSATLANKGLEVIEARWLFDVPPAQVDVVVHPQSIVHSLVEFIDGSVLAQLGLPDMRGPIALALAWPERLPVEVPRLDLAETARLDFEAPDLERFPCLGLAYRSLETGEAGPAVFNAANEIAVAAFLDGRISLPQIASVNDKVLERFGASGAGGTSPDLDAILDADGWARREAQEALRSLG